MFEHLIVVTEIGLAACLGVLAFRMTSLARTETVSLQSAPATVAPEIYAGLVRTNGTTHDSGYRRQATTRSHSGVDRAELITQLHILLGLQDRVCRDNGIDLHEAPDAIKTYAAAWLYGATAALTGPQERQTEAVARIACQLISKKTGLKTATAQQALATLTRCSVMLACYRSGLESAEFWLEHHYVPAEHALNTAITSNAFV